MSRILLRGGKVLGGDRGTPMPADVLIEDDRIIGVGTGLAPSDSAIDVVDLTGLHLAPGFIDMHSHSDVAVIAEPQNHAKVRQGITTEVVGQDGMGCAPYDPNADAGLRHLLVGLTGHSDQPWTWRTFASYLDDVEEARPATNVAALVAFGSIRNAVLRLEDRPATPDEIDRMCELVAEALDAGAFGMSAGLVYVPNVYATRAELVAVLREVAAFDGLFAVHVRSQGDFWVEAIDEVIGLSRESGVRLHVSHLCAMGPRNWPKIQLVLERLEAARASGLAVSFDQHPYTAASTMLAQVLPPWATEGGADAMAERLSRPADRARIRAEIAGPSRPGWENYAALAGWDAIEIADVAGIAGAARHALVGRRIGDLAEQSGHDPLDIVLDLLVAARGAIPMVMHGLYDDAGIEAIMRAPGATMGTDGVIAAHPHPRLYGSTARILERYVREREALSLGEAARALSGRAAALLRLADRGFVEPGCHADLVAFDAARVADRATYEAPGVHPDGIQHVLVNGQFVVRDGQATGARPGRLLRAVQAETHEAEP